RRRRAWVGTARGRRGDRGRSRGTSLPSRSSSCRLRRTRSTRSPPWGGSVDPHVPAGPDPPLRAAPLRVPGGYGRLALGGRRERRANRPGDPGGGRGGVPAAVPQRQPRPGGASASADPAPDTRVVRGGVGGAGGLAVRLDPGPSACLAPRTRPQACREAPRGPRGPRRARGLRGQQRGLARAGRTGHPRPRHGLPRRRRQRSCLMPAAFTPPAPRWMVRPAAPPQAVEALARTLEVPPALAALLWTRGLRDATPDHLEPPLVKSPNPALDAAAERLEEAVRARKRILIHGDYDADGISGTAVLLLGLRELGASVEAFIPDRLTDGYGIHPERVPEHAERAELFVTVDCGITNLSEIARLRAAGVDVIVTDHHTPGEVTPDCLVVHPRLSPLAKHGLPELTGAGVAFHLLWALRERMGLEPPLEYADLAA